MKNPVSDHDVPLTVTSEQLMTLLDDSVDPMFILDSDGCVVYANKVGVDLLRTKNGSRVTGRPITSIMPGIADTEWSSGHVEIRHEFTHGNRTFEPTLREALNADGNRSGYRLVLHDITHVKQLIRSQSEFMRVIAHDLRTPLTAMKGYADMLDAGTYGDLNDRQKHPIEKIMGGINQLASMLENIQDAGRYDPESGFYEMSRTHCDVGQMIRHIVDTRLIPPGKNLDISMAISNDVPIISADEVMIDRAIVNLIDNAIKYTPSGGTITVGSRVADGNLVVFVRDNGYGIREDDLKRLFERHVRLARPEHKTVKGTGLGLFIVRSVARRHGGDAWAESKVGEGSTFSFSIPLAGPNLLSASRS